MTAFVRRRHATDLDHSRRRPRSARSSPMQDPTPGPGEVASACRAAGINFADTLAHRLSISMRPSFPLFPAMRSRASLTRSVRAWTRIGSARRWSRSRNSRDMRTPSAALGRDGHAGEHQLRQGASIPVVWLTAVAHAG